MPENPVSVDRSDPVRPERGLPGVCCCPVVFGRRVTAMHCPVHGAEAFDANAAAEAHAVDRRKWIHEVDADG